VAFRRELALPYVACLPVLLTGLAVFAGASLGPLAAELRLGFAGLMLVLAALLVSGGALVAISDRGSAEIRSV
jgi:hypothetical protein